MSDATTRIGLDLEMNQYWSWLLTAWGVTGLYLAGRRRAAGWAVGLSAQGAWLTYAIVTHQWGFIVSAFAYGFVYCRNWSSWRRIEKGEADGRSR